MEGAVTALRELFPIPESPTVWLATYPVKLAPERETTLVNHASI